MNSDVIKTIFFYDDSHGNKVIENQNGDIQERSKEEVLNEIQYKISCNIILNYTVVRDQNLVTYQLNQEGGTVNLRMRLFDEVLPPLRNILRAVPRKVANTNRRDSIKITINEENSHVSYFSDQCVESKEISKNGEEVIDYIRCLKNNKEIISSIRDGKGNLCYIFETVEHEKFKIYVREDNKKVVAELDKLVTAKVKSKNKKRFPFFSGLVLCGLGVTFALLKNPSVQEKIQKIQEQSMEQKEANALLDKNFYRIESLYTRFKTSRLSEEEILELNDRLSEVLTYLHAIESKDECVGILEKYADDINIRLYTNYEGTKRR